MYQQRIAQVSLVLLLTMACGLISQPLDTSTPASPTPEIAGTGEGELVQIGYFGSLYLRYDPEVWEVFDETQGQLENEEGEPIRALRHRSIPGCILHENLGRGAPPTWERQDSERIIGGLEYRVEAWTDTEIGEPVLIVYQYPAGESGTGKRIELVIDQEAEACIQSAEEVLSRSADLISTPP